MKPGAQLGAALVVAFTASYGCGDSANPVEAPDPAATASPISTFAAVKQGGPGFRRQLNEDRANYSGFSWDGNSETWVTVFVELAGKSSQTAYLTFYGGRCTTTDGDWWWDRDCEYFDGWGPIPASDVSGGYQSGLVVDTDLRTNPDFTLWGATPGRVTVRWHRTGWYESRSSGSREDRWMIWTTRESGTSRSASAHAEGEIVGIPLPDQGWGDVSSGRGVWMHLERSGSVH